jgi:tetratricopeptide (TPR) repeat protein
MSGHHEEAVSVWRQAIALEETNWFSHSGLAMSYEHFGQYDDAIREHNRALEISDGNLRMKGMIARVYAVTGRDSEARAILQEIKGKPNSAFSMAEVYLALGEKKQALRYLRGAMDERCGWVVFMRVLPSLDPLRSDKRFQEMIRKIQFRSDVEPTRAQR